MFHSRDFSKQSLASINLSTVLPAMVCIDGNRQLSLVAVDAGLSISSRSAIRDILNAARELNAKILTLLTESDKICVRVGKSEAICQTWRAEQNG